MKKVLSLLVLLCVSLHIANAQQYGRKLDAFDFSTLKDKVLLIQPLGIDVKFDKEFERKNKFDKALDVQQKIAAYNKAWEDALAQSSYDATKYEFRGYSARDLFKEKNEKAVILDFYIDDASNRYVLLWITGPKKLCIASALINGLNLTVKEDIKLMFNMLNYSLNTSAELDSEGEKITRGSQKAKYKEKLVDYFDHLSDKTFLVAKFEEDTSAKNQEKEKAKTEIDNQNLADGLKANWTLSKYEILTAEQIEERKTIDGSQAFYWRNMNYYMRVNAGYVSFNVLGARINMLFTADKDEQIFQFIGGSKEFDAKTVKKVQDEFIKAAEKYRKQLGK